MALGRPEIETRVCIDDFGPFDCTLDLVSRWNGFVSPRFTLTTTRDLSAQVLQIADEYGNGCTDTVHVIDGRADSADTVHIIDLGLTRDIDDYGDREPFAIAVRVPWRGLDRGKKATADFATPAARKAARKSKATGRGASRSVVVHVRWLGMMEGGPLSVEIVQPDKNGRYPIGGYEWCWAIASWWCVCGGGGMAWHDLRCEVCDLHRDDRPGGPLGVATWAAGATLQRQAPGATSATVDLHDGHARIISVYAGDTEIDTADDTGPFDTETLGEADVILRQGLAESGPDALQAAGWQHVPDDRTTELYRITFPACS
ncbi:hypothetical protein [Streptomyces griseus]|uniref:hypothetical protein n=1 Tax=Streptomyces griseus TaxID=1911 RepID=UPI000A3A396A|nr:hypothetical protein [Streptomyces fimicarius]